MVHKLVSSLLKNSLSELHQLILNQLKLWKVQVDIGLEESLAEQLSDDNIDEILESIIYRC